MDDDFLCTHYYLHRLFVSLTGNNKSYMLLHCIIAGACLECNLCSVPSIIKQGREKGKIKRTQSGGTVTTTKSKQK
jgi:hypothetical protein